MVDSGPYGRSPLALLFAVVGVLVLDRPHVADRREETSRVEPVNPGERRELDGLNVAPRAPRADQSLSGRARQLVHPALRRRRHILPLSVAVEDEIDVPGRSSIAEAKNP